MKRIKFHSSTLNTILAKFLILTLAVGLTCVPGRVRADSSLMQPGKRLNLTLRGFNYTSRYIDSFNVNGQAGFNLYVSSPTSAGGSRICCVSYLLGASAPDITVRWQSGGCMYRPEVELASGATYLMHSFFREIKVKVDSRIPARPEFLEVHFYPDGRVEAAIMDRASSPRLKLNEEREDNSDFPRCPRDKEPKQ
jgi:hypothetical protein